MVMVRSSALALAALLLAACGSSNREPGPEPSDAGADAGVTSDASGTDGSAGDATTGDAGVRDTGPRPDAGPPVIIAFATSERLVTSGQLVRLVWNVTNADSLSIDANPGGPVVTSTTALHGQTSSNPLEVTTTFTLTAVNASGSAQRQAVVGVDPGTPTITSFTASPNPGQLNSTTVLSWNTTNATRVRILSGANTLFDTATMVDQGSWRTAPLTEAENAFTLEASNFAHQITALLVIPAN